jgi:hypothetical protein
MERREQLELPEVRCPGLAAFNSELVVPKIQAERSELLELGISCFQGPAAYIYYLLVAKLQVVRDACWSCPKLAVKALPP